ncbi:MAG: efflux RND transporter periplasmic adaptor subunit, partial [Gemmatimonas sp.]
MARSVTRGTAVRYRAHHSMANPFALVRRHLVAASALGVAVVVAVLGGLRLALGPQVAVEMVVRQNFVQTVVASGRVETPHRVDIGA